MRSATPEGALGKAEMWIEEPSLKPGAWGEAWPTLGSFWTIVEKHPEWNENKRKVSVLLTIIMQYSTRIPLFGFS